MSNMRRRSGTLHALRQGRSAVRNRVRARDRHALGLFQPEDGAALLQPRPAEGHPATHDQQLVANGGAVEVEGEMLHGELLRHRARASPGVFNLGGDLALFALLIKARDREALAHYAKLCIDNMYPRIQSFFSPTLTKISLVAGRRAGRRLRVRARLRRDRRRGKRADGPARDPVQPVPGHGRLQPARAPHRPARGRGADPVGQGAAGAPSCTRWAWSTCWRRTARARPRCATGSRRTPSGATACRPCSARASSSVR